MSVRFLSAQPYNKTFEPRKDAQESKKDNSWEQTVAIVAAVTAVAAAALAYSYFTSGTSSYSPNTGYSPGGDTRSPQLTTSSVMKDEGTLSQDVNSKNETIITGFPHQQNVNEQASPNRSGKEMLPDNNEI